MSELTFEPSGTLEIPAMQVMAKPISLVRKLAEVMATVGWIEKSGFNEFHKYKYAQEADLVSALRGELAKRHIMVFPHVKYYERKPLEVETLKWDENARAKVPTIRKTQLAEIIVDWTFVDGESGEERTVSIPGVGEDNVDKGFYKAFTGSEKYLLMKTFLIPTGDDPEKDNADDRETAKQSGKQAAQDKGKELVEAMKAKKGKKDAPEPPQAQQAYTPALFYTVQPSGKFMITGDDTLMRKLWSQFKSTYMEHGKCYLISDEQLNALQFQCQEGNIPLSQRKAADGN